jgi:hypothetical protein
VLVESCDEAISKENDHLKGKVKNLELEVNKLKKQTKVKPPQDNRSNMLNKLEQGRTVKRLPLNITRRMRRLNMQEVPT